MLICGGIVLAVAAAAFVPVAITWSRRHRHTEAITGAAVIWGLITAASLMYTTSQQINWSQERQKRVESGYYDPLNNSDAPKYPWPLWVGLSVAFIGLVAWGRSQKAPARSDRLDGSSPPA